MRAHVKLFVQVLHYCPGFREGIKTLYDLSKCQENPKEGAVESEKVGQQ